MSKLGKATEASALMPEDDAREAQVFRKLEAARLARQHREAESVVFLQFPDNRTLVQRLRAWWSLRALRATAITKTAAPK